MIGMKVEDRLDGATKFMSSKPRVIFILKENHLLKFINEKVPEQKLKKTSPSGGRVMLKQKGFWWT